MALDGTATVQAKAYLASKENELLVSNSDFGRRKYVSVKFGSSVKSSGVPSQNTSHALSGSTDEEGNMSKKGELHTCVFPWLFSQNFEYLVSKCMHVYIWAHDWAGHICISHSPLLSHVFKSSLGLEPIFLQASSGVCCCDIMSRPLVLSWLSAKGEIRREMIYEERMLCYDANYCTRVGWGTWSPFLMALSCPTLHGFAVSRE